MMKFVNELGEVAVENFRCHFEPITDYQWILHVTASRPSEHLKVKLSLFDNDLLRRDTAQVPPIAIDLIEIAAAVYAVDRSIQPDEMCHCNVEVVLPVRCPESLNHEQVNDKLSEILYWYTGYEWHFIFTKRDGLQRSSENPQLFNWQDQFISTDVALWSGGLDCLAGLYNRALENNQRQFVLCGTGANSVVHNLQRQVVNHLPKHLLSRVKLLQVRYETETLAGNMPDNARMRSRGFTFMLIGAVCAYLEGNSRLQVYENGIGAINLRFRESEVGLNHARSVHPLSLMLLAEWVSQILEHPFRLENPYLFSTKAEMCQVFSSKEDLMIAFQTETCDRKHRRVDAQQCGRCSSCILRRHAFAVLGIQDQTSYVYASSDWLHVPVTFESVDEGNHIPAVLYQLQSLRAHLVSAQPWESLVKQYETLAADIVDATSSYYGFSEYEMQAKLLQLFSQYVREWSSLQR